MRKARNIFIILFLIIIGVLIYLMFGNYSDGYRAGTMVKFSNKGYVFKTYEGQINLGMIMNDNNPGTTSVSSIWEFSVPAGNEQVVDLIQQALLTGKRIKLHYNEKFYVLPWRGDTKYFVDQAEIIP